MNEKDPEPRLGSPRLGSPQMPAVEENKVGSVPTEDPDSADESDLEQKELLYFTDCIGRKFSFPYGIARTQEGIGDLIRDAFIGIDVIYSLVVKGQYHLCLEDGWRIPLELWHRLINPGMRVTMVLFVDGEGTDEDEEADGDELPQQPKAVVSEEKLEDGRPDTPLIIDVSPPQDQEGHIVDRPHRDLEAVERDGDWYNGDTVRKSRSDARVPRHQEKAYGGLGAAALTREPSIIPAKARSAMLSKSRALQQDVFSNASSDIPRRHYSEVPTTKSRHGPARGNRAIFSVPSNTEQPTQMFMRRAATFPKASTMTNSRERRLRISSAQSYDREKEAIGSISRQTRLLLSETPSFGDHGPPKPQRSSHDKPNQPATNWIHVQRKTMDFVEFEHLCITEAHRLGMPLAAVTGLLQRVQSHHGPEQGGYVSPGTILRCDGGSPGNGKESATFASVPFLKGDKFVVFNEKMLREKRSHPSRPLYHAVSNFGGQTQRDREQVYSKYDGRLKKHVLWVNHVWILTMDSAILTYGDLSETDLCGHTMTLVKDDGSREYNQLSVALQLPDGRLVTVAVHPDMTYFDLQATIQKQLLKTYRMAGSQPLSFIDADGHALTPDRWLHLRDNKGRLHLRLNPEEQHGNQSSNASAGGSSTKGDRSSTDSRDHDSQVKPVQKTTSGFGGIKRQLTTLDDDLLGLPRYNNVPPFLAWDTPTHPTIGDDTELPGVYRVLEYLESNLTRPQMLTDLAGGDDVDDIPEGPDLLTLGTFTRSPEASYDQAKSRMETITSLWLSSIDQSDDSAFLLQQQKDEVKAHVTEVFQATRYLVDAFTPLKVDNHIVTRKCYGSLLGILDMVESLHDKRESKQSSQPNPLPEAFDDIWSKGKAFAKSSASNGFWIISDPPPERRMPGMHLLLSASDVANGCAACQRLEIYQGEKAAIRHLRERHLILPAADISKSIYRRFLVPSSEARESLRAFHLAKSLKRCKELLLRLCRCAAELQGGLLSDGKFSNPLVGLPIGLVISFERIVLFMCFMSYHASCIEKTFTPSPFSQLANVSEYFHGNLLILERLAGDAEKSMHRTQAQFVMALSTGGKMQQGSFFNEVGPKFIVGQIMCNLVSSQIVSGLSLSRVYRRYLEDLDTDCRHHPDKRKIQQLRSLAEEIFKLKIVNKWQMELVTTYEALCSPATYSNPSAARQQNFELESGLLSAQYDALLDQRRRLNEMLSESEDLGQFVIQATEIQKDDLNKTILAFTVVTIIFLPLSFVTSYLGMNTTFSDGTWNQTQGLFWKISLPLTVALGFLCLLLAFWEKTMTWLVNFLERLPLPQWREDNLSAFNRRDTKNETQSEEATGLNGVRRRVAFAGSSTSVDVNV